MNTLPRPRTSAFTLIELLVVIVIIAVLAGFILAALGRSKEQGHRTACMSNLRQLHTLVTNFAADNDGALPLGYRKGQKQFNTTLYTSESGFVLLGRLFAANLASDPHVFFCPSERDKTQALDKNENPWPDSVKWDKSGKAATTWQGGYGTNPLVDWGSSADLPPTPAKLVNLERVPLLADGVGMPKRVDSRHKDGVNVIYTDGSARWVPREKFETDLAGCTSISAGNNDAQDRIWQILGDKDPNQPQP